MVAGGDIRDLHGAGRAGQKINLVVDAILHYSPIAFVTASVVVVHF